PLVLALNKRDIADAVPQAELESRLNPNHVPVFETVATKGTGVFDALKSATSLALTEVRKKGQVPSGPIDVTPTTPPSPSPTIGRRPQTTPPPMAAVVLEDSGPVTLSSLGEVSDAIERLTPTDLQKTTSSPYRVPTQPARTLSELVQNGAIRDALASMEAEIDRGDWDAAVRTGAATYRDISGKLAGALAPIPGEAPALAALLTSVPANRYLRYREVTDRVEQGGAVSSTDALFVLFFLTDVALRLDDIKR